jgi:hypothetical protein
LFPDRESLVSNFPAEAAGERKYNNSFYSVDVLYLLFLEWTGCSKFMKTFLQLSQHFSSPTTPMVINYWKVGGGGGGGGGPLRTGSSS